MCLRAGSGSDPERSLRTSVDRVSTPRSISSPKFSSRPVVSLAWRIHARTPHPGRPSFPRPLSPPRWTEILPRSRLAAATSSAATPARIHRSRRESNRRSPRGVFPAPSRATHRTSPRRSISSISPSSSSSSASAVELVAPRDPPIPPPAFRIAEKTPFPPPLEGAVAATPGAGRDPSIALSVA